MPAYDHESDWMKQVATDCIWSDPASEDMESKSCFFLSYCFHLFSVTDVEMSSDLPVAFPSVDFVIFFIF